MKKDSRQKVFKKLNKTMSLKAIGQEFGGISGERVRQIIAGDIKPDVVKMVKENYINNLDKIIKNNLLTEIERLSTPSRRRELVLQRQALIRVLRDKYKFSFRQIAFLLKRKQHTSIAYLYYGRNKR